SSGSAYVALTKNDIFMLCGAGGEKVSLMQAKPKKDTVSVKERGNLKLANPLSNIFFQFHHIKFFIDPDSPVTFVDFHPKDNNIIIAGYDVSTFFCDLIWNRMVLLEYGNLEGMFFV